MNHKKYSNDDQTSFRILFDERNAVELLTSQIIAWLPRFPREYIIVCVGTDRSTGDALGPLTGTLLYGMKPRHLTVYGTLHDPVHAMNLSEYIDLIRENHRSPFIIAVDACLGKTASVGHIIAGVGPLKPGAALKKALPEIGDIHVTGVVNTSGFMDHAVLQSTRLSMVMDMAETIADSLNLLDQKLSPSLMRPAILIDDGEERRMI